MSLCAVAREFCGPLTQMRDVKLQAREENFKGREKYFLIAS